MSDVKVGVMSQSMFDATRRVHAELPWNAVGDALLYEVVDRLATKFVEEHGDAMLQLVDLNVVRAAVVEVVAARLRGDGAVTRDEVRDIARKTRDGVCVECGAAYKNNLRNASGWSFAPEFRATLRETGHDPATGHKAGCGLAREDAGR